MSNDRTAERHRNARLAWNLKTADVMTLDEVMAMVREYTRSFMDVPSPRANQLADEVERLRAVLSPPGLPAVLSSVSDVGAVCEAAGLGEGRHVLRAEFWESEHEIVRRDHDGLVRVWRRPSPSVTTWIADVPFNGPSSVLWAAIQAARTDGEPDA